MFRRLRPAHALALGYLSYIGIGFLLLLLPISYKTSVHWLDHLFISTSAVSTTGLATVDPGGTYTGFGQLIILLLIQFGGLGYMTASSFLILAANRKFTSERLSILKSAFSLPKTIGIAHFVRDLFVFTFFIELIGALLLYIEFSKHDLENPLWSAVFHSVSAFCTAGFSLYSTSFEAYKGDHSINMILAVLSIAGGIGFMSLQKKMDSSTGVVQWMIYQWRLLTLKHF